MKRSDRILLAAAALALLVLVVAVYVLYALGTGFLQALGAAIRFGELNEVGSYVLQTMAISAVAMATIQITRSLLPLRGRFHERFAIRWLAEGIGAMLYARTLTAKRDTFTKLQKLEEAPQGVRERAGPRAEQAMADLSRLAVARSREELFDLPIEELCGQVSAAAEQLIAAPLSATEAEHLQKARSERAEASEADLKNPPVHRVDLLLAGLAGVAGAVQADGYSEAWAVAEPELDSGDYRRGGATDSFVRRRNLLAQNIQRNLDGLQISVRHRWRRMVRGSATLICAVLALAMVLQADNETPAPAGEDPIWVVAFLSPLVTVLVTGLLGGYLATVLRDLVAVIERCRRA